MLCLNSSKLNTHTHVQRERPENNSNHPYCEERSRQLDIQRICRYLNKLLFSVACWFPDACKNSICNKSGICQVIQLSSFSLPKQLLSCDRSRTFSRSLKLDGSERQGIIELKVVPLIKEKQWRRWLDGKRGRKTEQEKRKGKELTEDDRK